MNGKRKIEQNPGGGVKSSKKIWKKWWFWALIVAVLIGGIIEYTEPEESTVTATAETVITTTERELETVETEPVEETESKKHIYDNAIVKNVMNGSRTEKIGEYSIIEIASNQVTEEILADWYFNYVEKNDFNWAMLLYTDKENKGVYAITGIINKDVTFDIDKYGDYSVGDLSKCIAYTPDEEGTLKEVKTE